MLDPLSLLFWPKGTTQSSWPPRNTSLTLCFSTLSPRYLIIIPLSPPSPHLQTLFHKMKKNNLKRGNVITTEKKKKVKNKMGKLITKEFWRKVEKKNVSFLFVICMLSRGGINNVCDEWPESLGVVESIEYTKRFDSFHPVSDGWAKTRLDFCFVFFFFVRECTCTFTSHRNCTSSRTPVYKMEMVYNKSEIVGGIKR